MHTVHYTSYVACSVCRNVHQTSRMVTCTCRPMSIASTCLARWSTKGSCTWLHRTLLSQSPWVNQEVGFIVLTWVQKSWSGVEYWRLKNVNIVTRFPFFLCNFMQQIKVSCNIYYVKYKIKWNILTPLYLLILMISLQTVTVNYSNISRYVCIFTFILLAIFVKIRRVKCFNILIHVINSTHLYCNMNVHFLINIEPLQYSTILRCANTLNYLCIEHERLGNLENSYI